MSVKGRKSRQEQPQFSDREHTLKIVFKPRRAIGRGHFPAENTWGAGGARQLLADALAQAQMESTALAEEGCTGCGLEQWAWLGNQGKGYINDGERYCCQGCADQHICPCQG